MMKKILSIILTFCLVLCLLGCSGVTSPSDETNGDTSQSDGTDNDNTTNNNAQDEDTSNGGGAQNSETSQDDKNTQPEKIKRGDGILVDFSAVDFDGDIVDSSIFDGYKVTMVNVWATWCNPCKHELPALAELHGENKDAGFQVVGVARDVVDDNFNKKEKEYHEAIQIISQKNINYRQLIPNKTLKGFLNVVDAVKSVPVTVFVDRNGYQLGSVYVGAKSKEDWKIVIDAMIEFIDDNP